MLLDASGINVRYGRNHAVRDVDISVQEGEIITVLGANGAGKSSLLKALSGTEKSDGAIMFDGTDIAGWSAPRRVQAGMVLVPEGRQIFVSLTVHENLLMGAYCRTDDVTAEAEAIYERFPNLAERQNMLASVLSGGEQQMLAISRAIGETMIVVMAAGLAANLTANPLETVTTVTVQIVTLLTGDQEFDSAKTLAAFALGLVLFIVTLLLNIVALRVVKKYREAYE